MEISEREKLINLRRLVVMFLLTTAFLILKINHLIDWSYWWIFCPLWIPILILISLGIIIILSEFMKVEKEEDSHFN